MGLFLLYHTQSPIFSQLLGGIYYWKVLGVMASGNPAVYGVDSLIQELQHVIVEIINKLSISRGLVGSDAALHSQECTTDHSSGGGVHGGSLMCC